MFYGIEHFTWLAFGGDRNRIMFFSQTHTIRDRDVLLLCPSCRVGEISVFEYPVSLIIPSQPEWLLSIVQTANTRNGGMIYWWYIYQHKYFFLNLQAGMCYLWDVPDNAPEPVEEVETSVNPLQTRVEQMVLTELTVKWIFKHGLLLSFLEKLGIGPVLRRAVQ